jgi:hypothetical protein
MAKTETELATKVLDTLGVIGAGQSAEAADIDLVIEAYRSKYAELDGNGLELVYWDPNEIPDAIYLILRDLIALEVRGDFGQPLSAMEREAEETAILKRLRRHNGRAATGLPVIAEYF